LVVSDDPVFPFAKSSAICPTIEPVIDTFKGAKFVELLDEVGTDSEQSTAQQRPIAFVIRVRSMFLAFLQHFIILLFGARRGVPDTTPPASATRIITNVSRLITTLEYILLTSVMSIDIFIDTFSATFI
jgi:hypothetical protein